MEPLMLPMKTMLPLAWRSIWIIEVSEKAIPRSEGANNPPPPPSPTPFFTPLPFHSYS